MNAIYRSALLALLVSFPVTAQKSGEQQSLAPSDQELSSGENLIVNKKWQEAVAYLAKLQQRFPKHERTLSLYAQSLHSSAQFEKALPLYQRLMKSKKAATARLARYQYACALAMLGKKEPAIYQLYQAVSQGFRQSASIKNNRELASLHDDIRFQKLVFALEDGEEPPVVQFRPSVRDAQMLIRVKRFDDAKKALETILSRQPGQPMAIYFLGYVLHMQGKLDQALPYHIKASAFRAPVGYSSAYNAACAHAQKGRLDAAFEWLGKAIDKGFKNKANLLNDEELKGLREDPRWTKLLERLQ
ncbi:MAG: hypothetical protein CSA62_05095 [Planctomycetota bacterium]|nr:MAG: hypothetical protein CSA62_05095 [Planctomycetota bacterium]